MSEQPWRDPGLSIDERLCHVLEHTVIVDALHKGVPGAVAILREAMRAVRADALEEGAAMLEQAQDASPDTPTGRALREAAFSLRSLKRLAPAP